QLTITAHPYNSGEWIFVQNVVGMTQLNNRYFIVTKTGANTVTLQDIFNNGNINGTGYTAYSSGGTAQRIYEIATPWLQNDLVLLKFSQNVNVMIFCHPNYEPRVLTLISATNWTLAPLTIGTTITPPTITSVTTAGGTGTAANYSYQATSIDVYGQESGPSAAFAKNTAADIFASRGSNNILLTGAVSGALFYNFYRARITNAASVPANTSYGFIGYSAGLNFIDDAIEADFSQTPPIPSNPFLTGASVISFAVTNQGNYAGSGSPPTMTVGAPTSGTTATGQLVWENVPGTLALSGGGGGYNIGNAITFTTGATCAVTNTSGSVITAISVTSNGNSWTTYPGTTLNQTSVAGSSGSGASLSYNYRL